MQVIISTRGMTVSRTYKDELTRKLAKLEPLLPALVETRAVLSKEKHRRTAALTLVARRRAFRSRETAPDLEAAVDRAVHALRRQVRETKARRPPPPHRRAIVTEPAAEPIRFVIITGLSGAGKSYAIKCLEDLNYFCVDNLPTTLIPTFAELCAQSSRGIPAIALGVDVREGEYLASMVGTLEELRTRGHRVDVLFLEASDESLVRRYHETRRRHPLAGEGNVLDGIRAERKALAHLREIADRIIDTSALTVHQLKDQMIQSYGPQTARGGLTVALVSFGFKHGVPYDGDLVFDVRFLPNPHFVEKLRAPGRARPRGRGVRDVVRGEPGAALAAGGAAQVPPAALRARREGLPHGRGGLHGRAASLGDDRGSAPLIPDRSRPESDRQAPGPGS